MRKKIYAVLGAASLAALLVPLIASGTTPGTQLSCLDWSTRTSAASTSSTTWKKVPGLAVTATLAQNFAVQVSGTFSGAPVKLRVSDASVGGTFALAPGATTFTPAATVGGPFSFTWVGTNPAEHQHTFALEWQRASGSGVASLKAGAMTAIYQGAPTPTTC